LYIAALLALCFGGAGPLSVDGYADARRWRLRSRLSRLGTRRTRSSVDVTAKEGNTPVPALTE
jgi:hypothetical protein